MKKWIFAFLWIVLPPLYIVLTTPFSQLSEHSIHIFLYAILGGGMALYSLRNQITETKRTQKKLSISTSLTTIIPAVVLLFCITFLMPCPYMYSPQSAQSMINHPCSQPTLSCTPLVSFAPTAMHIQEIITRTPSIPYTAPQYIPNNKAPPTV
jgi:hypothetical protein